MSKSVCYFGSYDAEYARNRIIIKGLKRNRVQVYHCNASGPIFVRYLKLALDFIKNKNKYVNIIIGFPGHFDIPLAYILGKIFKKRVFFDIFASTYETHVLDRQTIKKGSLKSYFFYLADWLGLHLCDYVITDTKAHLEFYVKTYGFKKEKGLVLYVGSDDDIFHPRKIRTKYDVLFYGSYQPLQGVSLIVKAAKLLPRFKFRLIGKGQTRVAAEKLSNKLSLKNIQFVDWVPLAILSEEISKAKIILGTFGSSEKAQSVIANKVYDGLACKKTVITSSNSAAHEILDSNHSVILVRNNPADVASAIKKLISNPRLNRKIAANGYKLYTSKLKPELVIQNLLKLLR